MRLGNIVMLLGLGLVLLGALLRYAPGLFSWFGNLPGDINYEGESSRVFIPITSMIIASVILTVLVNLAATLFRDR